jgi:hypothetical protein
MSTQKDAGVSVDTVQGVRARTTGPNRKDFVSPLTETEGIHIAWNRSRKRSMCGVE